MKFPVKGKRGAAVAAAILGFLAWQGLTAHTTLDEGLEAELAQRLRADYASEQLRAAASVREVTPEVIDSVLDAQNVSIESLSVVGPTDAMVAKVEIRVNGRPPADGKAVRYYRISYRVPRGWSIRSETSAFTYYSAFF